VFGLFFIGAAMIWGLAGDTVRAARGWPLPALLITVGVAGLLTALGTRRSRSEPDDANDPETR
jgi:hypothetical protein